MNDELSGMERAELLSWMYACNEGSAAFNAVRLAHHIGLPWEKKYSLYLGLARQERRFEPLLSAPIAAWSSDAHDRAARILQRCQSPIEELFVAVLCAARPTPAARCLLNPMLDECDDVARILDWYIPVDGEPGEAIAQVLQQARIEKYRVDFAITGCIRNVAIELDGHEFHERTKEQAARDKSRDRAITEAGWSVIRFTGSEVWKAPEQCVDQALRVAGFTG